MKFAEESWGGGGGGYATKFTPISHTNCTSVQNLISNEFYKSGLLHNGWIFRLSNLAGTSVV